MAEARRPTSNAPPTQARGRGAVAASILVVVLVGGYLASSVRVAEALPSGFLLSAAILVPTFWFPALRIGAPSDVLGSWRPLLVWLAAWTLVWDLATSGILGERDLFQEWWLVYPSGVGFLWLLLLFHGRVVQRVSARPPAP
jgi:hypothetical protein